MNKQPAYIKKTRWHRLLGMLLEELLTPVDIQVFTEFPVMNNPPEADILLLRNDKPEWSLEQKERLPDGIRDSKARHIILEFKYTESINETSFQQALGYHYFYKSHKGLSEQEVQTFLVSSKTPGSKKLDNFGYVSKDQAGVYINENPILKSVTLLSLNKLANKPHNAYIKCFASRKKEKQSAFEILMDRNNTSLSVKVQYIIINFWNLWFNSRRYEMIDEITPEKIMEWGKMWGDAYLASLSIEERLQGLKPKERLQGLKPKERLQGLTIEELEAYLQKLKKKRVKKAS
ncbi:conserved hypothetical protein [Candidatus Magnetomoraceae bacterium gMMP-15]